LEEDKTMANLEHSEFLNSKNIKRVISELQKLMEIPISTENEPTGTPIDLQVFRKMENQLKNIEFRLQFELLNAEDENNWSMADILYNAIHECQNTLNAVRAALIRIVLIQSDHDQIISEFRLIRKDIDSANRIQQIFDIFTRLAVVVRKFVAI
jgi:hypothetical protein